MALDYPTVSTPIHPPLRAYPRAWSRKSADSPEHICALWPMYWHGNGRDAGYHEPTRGYAAADLELE